MPGPVAGLVRRADIESFARELEARGRTRATITRRLCTIAGLLVRRSPGCLPGGSARKHFGTLALSDAARRPGQIGR
jgi:hypothetical protein